MMRWMPIAGLVGGVVLAGVLWKTMPLGADPSHLVGEADPQGPNPFDEQAQAASGKEPNVLFIVWDTVRADHLSVYGYERPTTPHLEAFAEDALVFEQAHSPGIWTLPSHASMFTGLPPESTGARETWMWLDTPQLTMAEHFQEHGYNTFSLAANTLLSKDTNLVQGFHVPMNTFKGKLAPMAKKATADKQAALPGDVSQELAPGWVPPEHGATNAEWARAAYKESAPLVTRTFLKWLDHRKRPETPFFAFLNLMEAHTPRLPSMEARQAVIDDPELIELGLKTDAAHINLHFYNFGKHDYTERELEAINAVYDATLWELDRATADLLAKLQSRGDLDDTIVVITSDHGENLGDHHLFNHRLTLAETLTHVPLLVRVPGMEGERIDTPVTTMDLFPTLSAWMGLPGPPGLGRIHLLDNPRPAVTRMELPLRREIETVAAVHPDVEVDPWMKSGHALVDSDLQKVIAYDEGDVVGYDLAADPTESTPVSPGQRQMLMLDRWRRTIPPYDPSLRTEADDPVHVRASQEELQQHLEALGYIQDDDD
jgi:arylsulfatase A-like enzyme